MPDLKISIGGRVYEVACQQGEEHYLQSAARLLDAEATVLSSQMGRVPEPRMLLMAGLMLADKTAAMEDTLRQLEKQVKTMSREVDTLRAAPPPAPERVEVPLVPDHVLDGLDELARRAEAMADTVEEKAAG